MSTLIDLDPDELPVVARALAAFIETRPMGDPDFDAARYALSRIEEASDE